MAASTPQDLPDIGPLANNFRIVIDNPLTPTTPPTGSTDLATLSAFVNTGDPVLPINSIVLSDTSGELSTVPDMYFDALNEICKINSSGGSITNSMNVTVSGNGHAIDDCNDYTVVGNGLPSSGCDRSIAFVGSSALGNTQPSISADDEFLVTNFSSIKMKSFLGSTFSSPTNTNFWEVDLGPAGYVSSGSAKHTNAVQPVTISDFTQYDSVTGEIVLPTSVDKTVTASILVSGAMDFTTQSVALTVYMYGSSSVANSAVIQATLSVAKIGSNVLTPVVGADYTIDSSTEFPRLFSTAGELISTTFTLVTDGGLGVPYNIEEGDRIVITFARIGTSPSDIYAGDINVSNVVVKCVENKLGAPI